MFTCLLCIIDTSFELKYLRNTWLYIHSKHIFDQTLQCYIDLKVDFRSKYKKIIHIRLYFIAATYLWNNALVEYIDRTRSYSLVIISRNCHKSYLMGQSKKIFSTCGQLGGRKTNVVLHSYTLSWWVYLYFRYRKCNGCYRHLIDIRSVVEKKSALSGNIGDIFKQLQILLGTLDWTTRWTCIHCLYIRTKSHRMSDGCRKKKLRIHCTTDVVFLKHSNKC